MSLCLADRILDRVRVFDAPAVVLRCALPFFFRSRVSLVLLVPCCPPRFVIGAGSDLVRLVQALLGLVVLDFMHRLRVLDVITVGLLGYRIPVKIVLGVNLWMIDRPVSVLRRLKLIRGELLPSFEVLTPLVRLTSVRILIHI